MNNKLDDIEMLLEKDFHDIMENNIKKMNEKMKGQNVSTLPREIVYMINVLTVLNSKINILNDEIHKLKRRIK